MHEPGPGRVNAASLPVCPTLGGVCEQLPVEAIPGLAIPAHRATGGQVVYLTEGGRPVAEIHPAGTAARLRDLEGTGDTRPSFTCPRCGRTSYHPADAAEGYCGACHDWTVERPAAVR